MAQSLDQTNVFVKHLPSELSDEGLRQLFLPYGDIISSKVMVDHQSGSSLGYGFVRFATTEATQQAIAGLHGHCIGTKSLLCKLSNSSPSVVTPELSTNLYIKPIPASMDEGGLREIFGGFGPIATAKVMVDKVTGESRQIGFVRYESQDHATAALNAMNGQKISDDQPNLIVKYAETEQQKAARKASRGQSPTHSGTYSPPTSPTATTATTTAPTTTTYYYPQPMMYSAMPYMHIPVAAAPYMAMLQFTPQSSPYNPVWRPPYVMAAEQAMSY